MNVKKIIWHVIVWAMIMVACFLFVLNVSQKTVDIVMLGMWVVIAAMLIALIRRIW